jgi:hypothetical protein
MQIDIPIKLALLVAKTYLFWTVLTPPNAAPRAQERRAGSQSEIIMRLTIGWGPLFVKVRDMGYCSLPLTLNIPCS